MKVYSNFIGIDIGKASFVTALYGEKQARSYKNTPSGIKLFIKEHLELLPKSLCVLETTGGYEMSVLLTLREQQYSVHRANTRKVKHFIRSYGNDAKTDALDAKALSVYGHERHAQLEIYQPASPLMQELYELVTRRHDLRQMLVAEKNRAKKPGAQRIKASCQALIEVLSEEMEIITKTVNRLIAQDKVLSEKKKALKTIPGIGDIIANELLILLPELGSINRKQIASLAGVAPKARDSGKYQGYRATGHGRQGVKPLLFLAAMAARNSHSELKPFYMQLIARGKSKMVALTALMRKILVIANARVRDLRCPILT